MAKATMSIPPLNPAAIPKRTARAAKAVPVLIAVGDLGIESFSCVSSKHLKNSETSSERGS